MPVLLTACIEVSNPTIYLAVGGPIWEPIGVSSGPGGEGLRSLTGEVTDCAAGLLLLNGIFSGQFVLPF